MITLEENGVELLTGDNINKNTAFLLKTKDVKIIQL